MRRRKLLAIFSILSIAIHAQNKDNVAFIAKGQMPSMAKDTKNTIHIVYGTGDSIMYMSSANGKNFSSPELVSVLPGLFASAMRGPQIAVTNVGIIVTACTNKGNIFSYKREATGKWTKGSRVNEANEVAKEALMALGGYGKLAYAVWLGVKNAGGQNVFGASSVDGGKTWSKNTLVYVSPDGTVCECCKPSVVVKGDVVYVMFRNLLKGNRDLYLTTSYDGGTHFDRGQKLGEGNWKLSGCPMDGGGLAIDNKNVPQTVWRREGKIYAATAGIPEKEIGEGRGCSIETVNGKKVYAWSEAGNVVIMKREGIKKTIGKGSLPQIKAIDEDRVICVWENNKQIYSSVFDL